MRNILVACASILVLSISVFAQNETKLCPTIQITSPTSLTSPGDTMTFSVKVENENPDLKYEWTASAGTIIEGQSTSTIKIATTPEMGDSIVIAKVIIQNLPADCSNEISGDATIAPTIRCALVDDYGKVSTTMEKSMLDGVFVTLLNTPEYTAFFQLTSEKGETVKQVKSRMSKIIKYAKYRGVNKNRFVFVIDTSKTNSYLTTAYFASKNNETPKCETCEIIRGEDVK